MHDTSTIDPQAIAALRELNPDDPAFLRELIDMFLQDVPQRFAELERAIAQSDALLLTRAAHTIKGSCSNFGAGNLAAIALTMESQGRAAAFGAAQDTFPSLRAEFALVEETLKQLR